MSPDIWVFHNFLVIHAAVPQISFQVLDLALVLRIMMATEHLSQLICILIQLKILTKSVITMMFIIPMIALELPKEALLKLPNLAIQVV